MGRKKQHSRQSKTVSHRNRTRTGELSLHLIERRKFKRAAPISIRVYGQLDGRYRYGADGCARNYVRSAARRSRSSARAPGLGVRQIRLRSSGLVRSRFPRSPLTRGAPPRPPVLRPGQTGAVFHFYEPGEILEQAAEDTLRSPTCQPAWDSCGRTWPA